MNNKRRKAIADVVSEITNIKDKLQEILDDEQFSYDNIPENLLESERATISEEAISTLEEMISNLEEVENMSEDITL